MDSLFASPVEVSHSYISRVLRKGDQAVDATTGNGHDTIFLAELVGSQGKVYAFDVQSQAVERTDLLLKEAGLRDRVELYQVGHEKMESYVYCRVRAVMFNLGYLPGGTHTLVTRPETTIIALKTALGLLLPFGIVTLVVYRGHKGGTEEAEEVNLFVSRLPNNRWNVIRCEFPNRGCVSPYTICIQSRG